MRRDCCYEPVKLIRSLRAKGQHVCGCITGHNARDNPPSSVYDLHFPTLLHEPHKFG